MLTGGLSRAKKQVREEVKYLHNSDGEQKEIDKKCYVYKGQNAQTHVVEGEQAAVRELEQLEEHFH